MNLDPHNLRQIEQLNQRGGRTLSMVDLIEAGTLSVEMAAYAMRAMIEHIWSVASTSGVMGQYERPAEVRAPRAWRKVRPEGAQQMRTNPVDAGKLERRHARQQSH